MHNNFFRSYLLSWAIVIVVIGGIIAFAFHAYSVDEVETAKDLEEYKYHFVMIVENRESAFWQDVYKSAKEQGEKNGAYVELLGENISDTYSVSELLEIAIYQKVDGIILEPSQETGMEDLIDKAVEQGIPVVTLMSDVPSSKRQTFVGISNYNLGEKYGQELVGMLENSDTTVAEKEAEKSIIVLEPLRNENRNNGQTYAGVKSAINIPNVTVNSLEINTISAFGTEEYIRNLIMEISGQADVIVCVDLVQTESTCQAVVDFNKVGEIRILGYFVSDIVLDAIETGVVDATLVVDTEEIGRESIQSLLEKYANNRVTDYVSINIETIDASNVEDYRSRHTDLVQEVYNEGR